MTGARCGPSASSKASEDPARVPARRSVPGPGRPARTQRRLARILAGTSAIWTCRVVSGPAVPSLLAVPTAVSKQLKRSPSPWESGKNRSAIRPPRRSLKAEPPAPDRSPLVGGDRAAVGSRSTLIWGLRRRGYCRSEQCPDRSSLLRGNLPVWRVLREPRPWELCRCRGGSGETTDGSGCELAGDGSDASAQSSWSGSSGVQELDELRPFVDETTVVGKFVDDAGEPTGAGSLELAARVEDELD